MIVGGISSQAASRSPKLAQAADKIQGWLQDLGVSSGARSRPTATPAPG
jgi:hypothetical protein